MASRQGGLFAFPGPRYIGPMSEKPLYVVSVMERDAAGKLSWRELPATTDHEEANALLAALQSDKEVKARLQVIQRK